MRTSRLLPGSRRLWLFQRRDGLVFSRLLACLEPLLASRLSEEARARWQAWLQTPPEARSPLVTPQDEVPPVSLGELDPAQRETLLLGLLVWLQELRLWLEGGSFEHEDEDEEETLLLVGTPDDWDDLDWALALLEGVLATEQLLPDEWWRNDCLRDVRRTREATWLQPIDLLN
jgi:hypothetical protein